MHVSFLGLAKVLTSHHLQSNVLLPYLPQCLSWDWEPCGIITAQTTVYHFKKPYSFLVYVLCSTEYFSWQK